MEKKLFLIDGHALIFKMYYAFFRRPMINSKGMDTSILFGFTKYILELIEKEKPSHLAVSFDLPGKTFRHEMYPEYKGTRSETPQLVIDSLEPLMEICKALRIPIIAQSGFEADDMIGSMAKIAEKEGFKVFMVSPDKDYGQLISENIIQYKPGKSGSENEIVDRSAICSKYGICEPLQVIDMLTICGDTSDNVPGVKGVGEVGASKLIAKYSSIENIYAHLEELTPKQREAFEAARGHIELSKTLVTIKTDIPIEEPTSNMVINYEYDAKIADLFEKYEFHSLRKFIKAAASQSESLPVKQSRTLELTKVSAKELCGKARMNGHISLTENSFGVVGKDGYFFCCCQPSEVKEVLEDENIENYGYDLKSQMKSLLQEGISLKGRLYDVELMHYLVNPEKSHKIEILAKSYLDISLEKEQTGETLSLFDEVESDDSQSEENSGKEAVTVVLLGQKVLEELVAADIAKLYLDMEEPLIGVLARMEMAGVKIDVSQLAHFADGLKKELDILQTEIREMAQEPELNISSPKQVGLVIYEKLKLDPKVKPGSKYSTDEETLTALADKHPIIDKILEFRGVKKLLSTYIEPLPGYIQPRTGKIHTTFNQALTATGRLSSSKPNLQNIPIRTERGKEIRRAFIPSSPDGIILAADYSQIELRIMAHLSCDSHLIEAFRSGEDVHKATAAKIFGISTDEVTSDQRRIAKTANFGIMYGISAFGLSQRLGMGRAEAKKLIEDYFGSFPSVSAYIADTIAAAKECGYVETLFGRRRYLPDITSRNATVRSIAERNAVNAPIQGTSADIIKMAMIAVDKRLEKEGLRSRMMLQIHDELVFDAARSEVDVLKAIVVEEMENVMKLSVPLTVECSYGKNWLEAK